MSKNDLKAMAEECFRKVTTGLNMVKDLEKPNTKLYNIIRSVNK